MSWKIHHVNVMAADLPASRHFYSDLLGMTDVGMPIKSGQRGKIEHDANWVAWYDDGNAQVHVCKPAEAIARDNNMFVNPLIRGHLAIQVDDIERVRRELDRREIYYSLQGNWALDGITQLYTVDPSMNVIEVNQRF